MHKMDSHPTENIEQGLLDFKTEAQYCKNKKGKIIGNRVVIILEQRIYYTCYQLQHFETFFFVQWHRFYVFHICGSVYHQSNLLINRLDAALSSLIYSLLRVYSTCFRCFLHPSSGVQLNCRYSHRYISCVCVVWLKSVERCPRSGVYCTMPWPTTQTHEMYLWLYLQFNCTPDDGCRKHPKHVEWTRSK
jgi:hypothetical protein